MLGILKKIKLLKHIHLYTLGIGCFISCLLFQTDVNQMGTKIALLSLGIIVIGTLLNINNPKNRKSPTFILTISLFFLFSLFSTFVNNTNVHYLLRYIAFFTTYLFICSFRISDIENEFLKDVFSIAMSVYAALTAYSYIYNPVTTNYIHSDVALFGTLMDPNYVSIPFVATVNLCFANVVARKNVSINIIMLFINLLAILCAASRGAVVALIISLLLNLWIIQKLSYKKILLTIFTILFISYLILPFIFSSFGEQFTRMSEFGIEDNNGRFELWGKAFELFLSSPILGVGLGGMVETMGHASHNTYFQVFTETGLVGFIFFTMLVIKMLRRSFEMDKTICIMFIGYLIQIFFVDALGDRLLWLMFIWISILSFPYENKTKA